MRFRTPKFTKGRLARNCQAIEAALLEETAARPPSLLRLPDDLEGQRFFQRHPGKGFPFSISTTRISGKYGNAEPRSFVVDTAGLVGAVQIGTVEFHIRGVRPDHIESPDRLVFDLYPDEASGFGADISAAENLRSLCGCRDFIRRLAV